MESADPNFNIGFSEDSDDDNSIFITQEPSQKRVNMAESDVLNKAQVDIDFEGLLETSNDSAIGNACSPEPIVDLSQRSISQNDTDHLRSL